MNALLESLLLLTTTFFPAASSSSSPALRDDDDDDDDDENDLATPLPRSRRCARSHAVDAVVAAATTFAAEN
jgi:hypothetical protein